MQFIITEHKIWRRKSNFKEINEKSKNWDVNNLKRKFGYSHEFEGLGVLSLEKLYGGGCIRKYIEKIIEKFLWEYIIEGLTN